MKTPDKKGSKTASIPRNPSSRPPRESIHDRDLNEDEQKVITNIDDDPYQYYSGDPNDGGDVEEEEDRERKRKAEEKSGRSAN